jgi:GNAT superfamily N-acetyltransferase
MMTTLHLADPSPTALAAAVEENLFELFRAMAEVLPGSELRESTKLSYHLSFPSNPMFKGVWRTRLDSDEVEAEIERTLAWFKSREAPFLFWWTGPGTQPPDLGERLAARGLLSMEGQMAALAPGLKQSAIGAPGMVADLHQLNEALLEQVPPGFSVERVHNTTDLHDFKQVFVESYEIPEWAGQAWVDATLKVGIGQTPWQMYLGRLHGKAVATNMLFNGGGVASVYAVGVIPSARGQGIGAAITLKPLLEARDLGYRHAVLFSTEMGIRVYERLGFRLTNVRINRYLWRNA